MVNAIALFIIVVVHVCFYFHFLFLKPARLNVKAMSCTACPVSGSWLSLIFWFGAAWVPGPPWGNGSPLPLPSPLLMRICSAAQHSKVARPLECASHAQPTQCIAAAKVWLDWGYSRGCSDPSLQRCVPLSLFLSLSVSVSASVSAYLFLSLSSL